VREFTARHDLKKTLVFIHCIILSVKALKIKTNKGPTKAVQVTTLCLPNGKQKFRF